ncbi:MAG: TPM domain-containing protein [Paramuribaculum sp.]|nr:TPM domain-containing protein [Paramuribaculum sp.]
MNALRIFFTTVVLLCVSGLTSAMVYSPEAVPNVQVLDSTQYVSNPDGILSAEAVRTINGAISSIRRSTTAEMAVVVVDDIDRDINDFATRLFELWGVGRSGNSNGVLVVVAKDARKAVIRTGYGAEGVLPDAVCSRIIRNDMAPEFKQGNYDRGTVNAVLHVTQILSNPEAAAEMRHNSEVKDRDFSGSALFVWYLNLCGVVAGVMFVLVMFMLVSTRKLPEQDRWRKLNNIKPVALFACFFGLGMPLVAYIPLVVTMRRIRSKHRNCPNCAHRMNKLDEESDNNYLTPSQDLEEHLNSIDYDVWLCPNCGEKDVIPYVNLRSSYTVCPDCGAKACSLAGDRVIMKPTTARSGQGQRIYTCANCRKSTYKNYIIPKLAVPVVVVGSGFGSGGRGGGFGGGGFGGGMTGGGGASGGW